jgi:hypothetical protein
MSNALLALLFRFICAVVVAACICGAGVAFGSVLLFGPAPAGGALTALFSTLMVAILVSVPLVGAGTVVIGIPADWLLRRLGLRHPLVYAGVGAAAGFLPAIPFAVAMGDNLGPMPLIFPAYGLVAACSYWYFVTRLSAPDD